MVPWLAPSSVPRVLNRPGLGATSPEGFEVGLVFPQLDEKLPESRVPRRPLGGERVLRHHRTARSQSAVEVSVQPVPARGAVAGQRSDLVSIAVDLRNVLPVQ